MLPVVATPSWCCSWRVRIERMKILSLISPAAPLHQWPGDLAQSALLHPTHPTEAETRITTGLYYSYRTACNRLRKDNYLCGYLEQVSSGESLVAVCWSQRGGPVQLEERFQSIPTTRVTLVLQVSRTKASLHKGLVKIHVVRRWERERERDYPRISKVNCLTDRSVTVKN